MAKGLYIWTSLSSFIDKILKPLFWVYAYYVLRCFAQNFTFITSDILPVLWWISQDKPFYVHKPLKFSNFSGFVWKLMNQSTQNFLSIIMHINEHKCQIWDIAHAYCHTLNDLNCITLIIDLKTNKYCSLCVSIMYV